MRTQPPPDLDILHPLDPAQPVYGYAPADPAAPPAVSVITPHYNTGPLLYDTATALLRQSLQQWEWVIADDGSDDPAALRALQPLRSADPRVRVIDLPHRGLAATRSAGVAASRAPLLFFLDSDDLLTPTALEQLAWSLAARPTSAFAGGWIATFGGETIGSRRGFDTPHVFPHDSAVVVTSMARRSAYDAVGGFDDEGRPERGLEDYLFWVRAADRGLWGHDVHELLVWLRRKTPAEYASYRWAFMDDQRVRVQLRQELRARYPALFRDGPPAPAGDGAPLDVYSPIPVELPFANRLARPGGQRRVLLLLPTMVVGGSERFAIDLAAGLVARGARVSVALLQEGGAWLGELRRVTPDVFVLPRFLRPADYPRFLHYLIQSRGITTTMISNSFLAYRLLPYLRARCPQTAFVDYLHLEQEQRHGGVPRAGLDHDRLLDMHITASANLRRWMVEHGADPARVQPCLINIDAQRWAPDPTLRARVRAELGVDDATPLVLFVGRLSYEKRPALAVEILRRVAAEGAPFVAVFAGEGEQTGLLRRRARPLGGRVRLLGGVSHDRVRELMCAADLLLLPSQREGIALTLYEALACGVVPVAADVGGQAELVTPDVGVLVPHGPDEAERYVAALRRLLGDRALREQMGRAGRARVLAEFDAPLMIERMERLLDQAAAAPRLGEPVGEGAGLAMASLAIEHHRLEQRVRNLPPVRLLTRLRRASAAPLLARLIGVGRLLRRFDRAIYVARREAMWRVKRLLGRPYNP